MISTKWASINKVCCIGQNMEGHNVFVRIKFKDERLSITGVEGPYKSGNCAGSCGQINGSVNEDSFSNFAEGWNHYIAKRFFEIWDRWHLNDMIPGTPRQMKVIRAKQEELDATDKLHKEAPHAYASQMVFTSYYDMELAWLEEADLKFDGDYLFGSAWLKESVPDIVVNFLNELPETKIPYHWV